MESVPIAKRKWHITIELSNGQVSYSSIVPVDLVKYIKKERKRKSDGELRKLTPAISWVIDAILKDCKNMLTLYKSKNKPEIVSIEVTQSVKEKKNNGQ